MASTRRRISCPMLVANFVGHSGLVRWKCTVTCPSTTFTSSRRPSSFNERRISGSRVEPAAARTASRSISVIIVLASSLSFSGCAGIGALALSNLVVFQALELAIDINAIEAGDISTDDLVFDFIGEVNPILRFDVVWQLEGHKIVKLPVWVPDGEVGAIDDAVRAEPEEQVRHHFREEAGAVVDESQRHSQRTVD